MPRRHWGCGYNNSGGWPWMYAQQPRGWAEQSWSMGYGQRPQYGDHHHHSHYPSQHLCVVPEQNALDVDALSVLFARLILESYLTQMSGDAHGCRSGGGGGGGALWGCNVHGTVSASSHTQPCHTHHACAGSGSGSGANPTGNNLNRNSMCHTCPAATRPYMGPNNVFVIPSGYVQHARCGSGSGGIGNGGCGPVNIDPNNNNNTLNMLLNGLGLGCGREQGMNCSAPAAAGSCSAHAAGHGPPNNHNTSSRFHCDQCNFHMVY